MILSNIPHTDGDTLQSQPFAMGGEWKKIVTSSAGKDKGSLCRPLG
jgi:hypothetical protein